MDKIRSLILFVIFIISSLGCYNTKVKYIPTEEEQIRTYVEHIKNSTVALVNYDEDSEQYKVHCSGVWIRKDLILTANHCVVESLEDNPVNKEIEFITYKEQGNLLEVNSIINKAKVINNDMKKDLALLKANTNAYHETINLSKRIINSGERVNIVSSPARMPFSYLEGNISSIRNMKGLHKHIMKLYQVSIFTIGGLSGGGLYNKQGELIGICSFNKGDTLGFFIHKDMIENFLMEKVK